jgi:hypothetical protein
MSTVSTPIIDAPTMQGKLNWRCRFGEIDIVAAEVVNTVPFSSLSADGGFVPGWCLLPQWERPPTRFPFVRAQ